MTHARQWDLAIYSVKHNTSFPVTKGAAHEHVCRFAGTAPAPSQGARNIFETFQAAQGSLVPNSPSYK